MPDHLTSASRQKQASPDGRGSGRRALLRAQDPHAHDVLVCSLDPCVLALPTLDQKIRLLVRADRGDVRRDRLKVNPAEVVTHESEFDELDDGRCADTATPGVPFQTDARLGVAGEQVEVE